MIIAFRAGSPNFFNLRTANARANHSKLFEHSKVMGSSLAGSFGWFQMQLNKNCFSGNQKMCLRGEPFVEDRDTKSSHVYKVFMTP